VEETRSKGSVIEGGKKPGMVIAMLLYNGQLLARKPTWLLCLCSLVNSPVYWYCSPVRSILELTYNININAPVACRVLPELLSYFLLAKCPPCQSLLLVAKAVRCRLLIALAAAAS